jgi:hypothetical protein
MGTNAALLRETTRLRPYRQRGRSASDGIVMHRDMSRTPRRPMTTAPQDDLLRGQTIHRDA